MQSLLRHSIVALILLLQACMQRASAQEMTTAFYDQMHLSALIERTDAAKPRPAAPRPMPRLAALRVRTGWDASVGRASLGVAARKTTSLRRGERQYVPGPVTAGSGLHQTSPRSEFFRSHPAGGTLTSELHFSVHRIGVRGRAGETNPVKLQLNRIPQERTIENKRHSNGMSNRQLDFRVLRQDIAIREGGVNPWERRLAIAQGSYYLITGLWPILHMQSFEKVTGPKTDDWLVKTVGAMITVVGGTLLISGLDDGPSNDMKLVAVGSAAALAAVDVTYVAQGRISRIYLLDAVAELALIIGWGLTVY